MTAATILASVVLVGLVARDLAAVVQVLTADDDHPACPVVELNIYRKERSA